MSTWTAGFYNFNLFQFTHTVVPQPYSHQAALLQRDHEGVCKLPILSTRMTKAIGIDSGTTYW